MRLFINFLNSIAYYYYPKGLHESDNSYGNSEQRKNYLVLHDSWNGLKTEIESVILLLKDKIRGSDLIINGTSNNTPCYEIEILLETNEKEKSVIVIYISLFIPFYHIVRLSSDLRGRIRYSFDIPEEVDTVSSKVIHEFLGYQKFPETLLNHQIPYLKVCSNFDYLRAFFTDGYRVAHI